MFCPIVSYMTEASSRWYGDMLKERTLMERFCDEDRENALADYYNYIALSAFLDTPGSVEYDTVIMSLIEYLLNVETEAETDAETETETGTTAASDTGANANTIPADADNVKTHFEELVI